MRQNWHGMCYVYAVIAKTNMQQEQNSYYPQPQGLYNSANEHDACGVGMVADINGVKNDEIQLYQMPLLAESVSSAAKTNRMSGIGK